MRGFARQFAFLVRAAKGEKGAQKKKWAHNPSTTERSKKRLPRNQSMTQPLARARLRCKLCEKDAGSKARPLKKADGPKRAHTCLRFGVVVL